MDTVGGVVASGKRRYAGCPLGGAKLIRHDFPRSVSGVAAFFPLAGVFGVAAFFPLAGVAAFFPPVNAWLAAGWQFWVHGAGSQQGPRGG